MCQLQIRTSFCILVTTQQPLTVIYCYHLIQKLHPSFVSFLNNALYSKKDQVSVTSYLEVMNLQCFLFCFLAVFSFVLFFFTLKQQFDFDNPNIVKIINQLFYRMSLRLYLFEMSNVGYRVLIGKTEKILAPSSILSDRTLFQSVPLLIMLNLVP